LCDDNYKFSFSTSSPRYMKNDTIIRFWLCISFKANRCFLFYIMFSFFGYVFNFSCIKRRKKCPRKYKKKSELTRVFFLSFLFWNFESYNNRVSYENRRWKHDSKAINFIIFYHSLSHSLSIYSRGRFHININVYIML
jgi:hypothetical protein